MDINSFFDLELYRMVLGVVCVTLLYGALYIISLNQRVVVEIGILFTNLLFIKLLRAEKVTSRKDI